MAHAVELDNLSFRYPEDPTWILQDAKFQIPAGSSVGIAGPNGCGKSTIVRLLLGMIRPTSGWAMLFGQSVNTNDHLPQIGLMSHMSHEDDESALPNALSVGALLDCFHRLLELSDDASAKTLLSNLELGGPRIQRMPIGKLSKGQRQRLIAYLALSKRPQLILADEPLDGLDTTSRDLIATVVKDHLMREGTTLIWISHSRQELHQFTGRHVTIENARIVELAKLDCEIQLETHGTIQHFASAHPEAVFGDVCRQIADGRIRQASISLSVKTGANHATC